MGRRSPTAERLPSNPSGDLVSTYHDRIANSKPVPRRHLTPDHEHLFGRSADVLWLDPNDPLLLDDRLWRGDRNDGTRDRLVPRGWTVKDCLRLAWHQHELVLAARAHLGLPDTGLATAVEEAIRPVRQSTDSVRRKVRGEWPLTTTDLLVWPRALGLGLAPWMPATKEPPLDPAGAQRLGIPPK